ncbi:MAG: LysM domain protein [Firmicutes bacterium]|nr:LysM domain protein [Bacillota bacterium]
MGMVIIILLTAMFVLFILPQKASAHCDTLDGPTAADGMKALDTGNINYVLKWIMPEYEQELRETFEKSIKVRKLSQDAKELADRYFLENLVRLHRAGEGAPFEGLKPHGTPIDEKVAAADRSIEAGNLSPLEGLISEEEMPELKERFEKVMATKGFDVNDVQAGRRYIEAYVSFFKFAEGESHEEKNVHGMAHGHHR